MSLALQTGFDCTICGEHHPELPLKYSVPAPLAFFRVPPEERTTRIVITPEQCVIDNRDFYLRGRILVPVHGLEDPFVWGIWAEISPKNFFLTHELWNSPGREDTPAFPGWLDSEIPIFGNTHNLEIEVHTQPVGRRPHFTVADPNHPLAIEQREGITLERVREIAARMHHQEPEPVLAGS